MIIRRELIVAVDVNGAIGSKGGLGFSCKEDMAWFKWYTMGKTLLCGKNTYTTIANLPGRTVKQLSRGEEYPEGCYVGGGQVYSSVIGIVDRAVVTFLNTEIKNADTFFDLRELTQFGQSMTVRDESWGRVVIYERY
jgi:dihydrofolate reductase